MSARTLPTITAVVGFWMTFGLGGLAAQGVDLAGAKPLASGAGMEQVSNLVRSMVPEGNAELNEMLGRKFVEHLRINSPMAAEQFLAGRMDSGELEARLRVFVRDNPDLLGRSPTVAAVSARERVAEILTRSPELGSTLADRLALADEFIERLGDKNRIARDDLMSGRMPSEELESRLKVFLADLKADATVTAADPDAAALSAIIESYIRANFGHPRERVNSISFRGAIEEKGRKREFVVFKKRPGLMRAHLLDDGVVGLIVGYDGTHGWNQRPSEPAVRVVGSDETEIAEMARFDPLLVNYRERGAAVFREDKPGTGPVVIRVRERDGTESVSTLDPTTLVELSTRSKSVLTGTVEMKFSDYRKVGVLNIPYVHEKWVNGVLKSTTRIGAVIADPALLDSFFARPVRQELGYTDYLGALHQVRRLERTVPVSTRLDDLKR